MSSNFEYDLLNYDAYGNTPNPYDHTSDDDVADNKFYPDVEEGFTWVVSNIEMIAVYPVIMIVNLMLFVTIVKNEKIRKDPWRWLIGHSSLCIFFAALTLYINRFTVVYRLPSLYTTALCPMVITVSAILWNIVVISLVLVAFERFRTLRLGKGNEGGMTKMTVILTLSVFWLLAVFVQTVPLAIEPSFHGTEPFFYFDMMPGYKACYSINMVIPTIARIILFLCAVIAIVTVIIGTIVLSSKKETTPETRQAIIVPTLTFSTLFFLFALGSECINVLTLIYVIPLTQIAHTLLHFLLLLTWISFPITWLVTWTRSGDISWNKKDICPCCHGNNEEQRHLLESK